MRSISPQGIPPFKAETSPLLFRERSSHQCGARIATELRVISTLVDALADRLTALCRRTHPGLLTEFPDAFKLETLPQLVSLFSSRRYPRTAEANDQLAGALCPLFRSFSRQLELVQSAVLIEFPPSSARSGFSHLIDALRTHAEEAILRCPSDPTGTAVEYMRHLRGELRLGGAENYWYTRGHLPAARGFDIQLFDPKRLRPGISLVQHLEGICSELTIDPQLDQPQEGFSRGLKFAELSNELQKPGAVLLLPRYHRSPIGLALLHTSPEAVPESAREALARSATGECFTPGKDGWVTIIGLARTERGILKSTGCSPYRVVTEALCESACGFGLERLWGDVRVGQQANTAIEKHRALGWCEIGVFSEHNGFQYSIVTLSPQGYLAGRSIDQFSFSEPLMPLRGEWQVTFNRLTQLVSDFDYCGLDSPDVPQFKAERVQNRAALAEEFRAQSGLDASLSVQKVADVFEVLVTPNGSLDEFAIRQKVPGKDLWKVEESDYYLLGIGRELISFTECIRRFKELVGSRMSR